MASIEESVSEISTIQDNVNAQQTGVLDVSGKLEEVSGRAAAAKQEIQDVAGQATGAATNLEELISATMAIGYGPNAQEVNAAKELVEESRNIIQAASEQVEQLANQLQGLKTEIEQANGQLQQSHTTLEEAKTRLQSLSLGSKVGRSGAATSQGGAPASAGATSAAAPRKPRNHHLAGQAHPTTSVPFDKDGYPDFSKWRHPDVPAVRIVLTGSRSKDFAAANRLAGLSSTPDGYTWHHHQDPGLMILVETSVHRKTGHSGGFSNGARL